MKVLVITPTTGSEELVDAIYSVKNQTYETDHLLICDGKQFTNKVSKIVEDYSYPKLDVCYLPYNTGGNGFYGHRIMAAFGHLIEHDVVLFLDQDNWYSTDHVETMVKLLQKYNYDWVYSLRKVFDKDRKFLLDDNCESLGRWPAWVNDQAYLIDSSCYCFKTDFFRKFGHIWDFGWGADRRFYSIIKDELKHKNYACTGKHTLNYRLGGNEGSVTEEFFKQGNEVMRNKYKDSFPWHATFS